MSTERIFKTVDRQEFLKTLGRSVAGVALLGGVGTLLTGCSEEQPPAAVVDTTQAPQWPFAYVGLDADKAAERGFNSYKTDGG